MVETYLDHAGEKFCLEYDANSWLYVSKAMDLFDLGFKSRSKALEARSKAELLYSGKVSSDIPKLAIPETPYQEKSTKAITTVEEGLLDLKKGMSRLANKDVLVVGVESDILFPVWQQREIADVLMENNVSGKVEYFELGNDISSYGHDTFLLSLNDIGKPVKKFLEE